MPLLGALLVSLFSGFATFFTADVAKKFVFGAVAVGFFTTLTLGLFVLMRTTISNLASGSSLAGMLAMFFSAAVPPIAPACLSAIVTIWTGCTLYKWQAKILDLFRAA